MVYPIGFGAGATNRSGTGFQLLAIIFTEFFGVTLAQLVGALAPSIQVRSLSLLDLCVAGFIDLNPFGCCFCVGRDVVQFRDRHSSVRDLRRYHSVPRHPRLATSVAVRVEPLG